MEYLEQLGYKVVSDNLNNLEVECKNHHRFKRAYSNFMRGTIECMYCIDDNKIEFLESLGFTVLSKNLGHDLEVECKNHHRFKRAYNKFKNGNIDCMHCTNNNKVEFLASLGYTVLSDTIGHDLEIECKQGHRFKRIYDNFIKGAIDCMSCANDNKIKWLNTFGHIVLSDNLTDNLEVECTNGHRFKRAYDSFTKGATKCPICYPYISSQELEIKKLLEDNNIEFIHSDWNTLGNSKELDFYIPSYNLAIEFDGTYWHSELRGKTNIYHLEKTQICESKGINLLHIFENEWNTKKEIWKSIIKGKLGMHNRISSKECYIKEVSKADECTFLEENHLQGFVESQVALGLYYNEELVSLMTFRKTQTNADWELLRFASKLNTNIIGGASKLFKYFTDKHSGTVVSYSDRRYSNENMYSKLGFVFSHNSAPNYFYFKDNLKLKRSISLTEWENIKATGYNRIWDCGNSVWLH